MRNFPNRNHEEFVLTLLLVCANESKSEFFSDFLTTNLGLFDNLIAYDDASSDGTVEVLRDAGFQVIQGTFSKFKNELIIRDQLMREAKTRFPKTDWFFILDSDELLFASRKELESLISEARTRDCDGISFHLVNLWKCRTQFRLDELFNRVKKVHAWRNTEDHSFSRESGLHKQLHPTSIKRILDQDRLVIVHLGFSSSSLILRKFISYKKLGQKSRMLWRLIDERGLQLADISSINNRLGARASDWIANQEQIIINQTNLAQYLWTVRKLEKSITPVKRDRPLVTLISLIYEGIDWLEFAYGELLTLQDELQDGVADILFCANDPSDEIVEFLQSNNIPHILFRNQNPEEHYLSRVYRAYNHAVVEASGEYCLLVNSDMAYSPGFLTRMLDKRSSTSLVVGQLVESGTLTPGPLAIKKNFGRNLREFKREKFIKFASSIKGPETQLGGLFMPLLVQRKAFFTLGGFPEGNLRPNSLQSYTEGGEPTISLPGEPCVSGDAALFKKAEYLGIQHFTNTHAVAYHFQEGEKRHSTTRRNGAVHSGIAIANDSLNGVNNERVLWNVLVDLLRDVGVKVLEWNTGKIRFTLVSLRKHAKLSFKPQGSPRVKLQNATYLPQIQGAIRNICLLQDRVYLEKLEKLQTRVLTTSDTIVTNSIQMIDLDSNSHFVWQPLPINDLWIESPLPPERIHLRTIFVGALDTTKGWEEVKQIILANPSIEFLVVSKYSEDAESQLISELPNVDVFHKLSQTVLITLMDTCELFLLGSPFETQCLAAMEAAMRDLAIIMKPTGMLGESPNHDDFGYFSEDLHGAFQSAVADYSNGRRKHPRESILGMNFTASEIQKEWLSLLSLELRESFKPKIGNNRSIIQRLKVKFFGVRRIKLND